jgi:hypothetical protein
MIMNHTIDIEEMPVKKDFVRGVSYLTGQLCTCNLFVIDFKVVNYLI